ncbi:hypothetical protein BJX68DRAFT_37762 [Aspergillus pseudodeflectus]|uniref:Uncharacterized protein n=1 Tax=Aspergillus pseudodeflectus TaxID=176178 RepID=A0ABR4KPL1_9EURO
MYSRLFITAQTEESPDAKRAFTISPAEINLRLLWCHHLCRVCPFPRNKRNDVIGRFARLFFPRRKKPTLLSSAITPYIVLNLTCISRFPGFCILRVPSRCPRLWSLPATRTAAFVKGAASLDQRLQTVS